MFYGWTRCQPTQKSAVMSRQDGIDLIKKIQATMKPATAKKKYSTGLAELDWQEVLIGDFTAEQCQACVKRVISKLRKFRSLEELLEDASRQLKNDKRMILTPEAERRYRSEYGNKPPKGTTASRLYVDKMVAKEMEKNPELHKLDLKKKYVSKWHNSLSDKKKVKYIEKALKAKAKYEEALKVYHEVDPDYNPNVPPFISKSDQKLLDQSQGVPEPPPRSGYHYFFHLVSERLEHDSEYSKLSLMQRSKKIGKEWHELSADKKAEYSKKIEEENQRYKEKMEEFLSKLSPEEKSQFEANHLKTSRKSSKATVENYVTAVELYQVMKRSKFEAKYPNKSPEEILSLMKETYDSMSEKKKAKYKEQEGNLRNIASTKIASPGKRPPGLNHEVKSPKKSVPAKDVEQKAVKKSKKKDQKAETQVQKKPTQPSTSSSGSSDDSSSSSDEETSSKSPVRQVTGVNVNHKKSSSSSSSMSSSDSSSSSEPKKSSEKMTNKPTAKVEASSNGKGQNITASFSSSSSSSESLDSSSEDEVKVKKKAIEHKVESKKKSSSSSSSSDSSSDDEVQTKKRKLENESETKKKVASSSSSSISSSDDEPKKKKRKVLKAKVKPLASPTIPGIKRLVSSSHKTPVLKGKSAETTVVKTPTVKEKVFLTPAQNPTSSVKSSARKKTPSSGKKVGANSQKTPSSKDMSPLSSPKTKSAKKKTLSSKVKLDMGHTETPVLKKKRPMPKVKLTAEKISSDSDSD